MVVTASQSAKIKFSRAKSFRDGIRVQPDSSDDFRALVKLLEKLNVQYHTFTLAEERTERVVIRGLPISLTAKEIGEDLQGQNLEPISVSRMRRGNKQLPLVMVEFHQNRKEEAFSLKTICGLVIQVERPRKSATPSQCHRCQRFHHSQRHCTAAPRCVKCAEEHNTSDCKKSKKAPAKCANCGGPHPANYKGCPEFPKSRPAAAAAPKRPAPVSKPPQPRVAPRATPAPKSAAQAVARAPAPKATAPKAAAPGPKINPSKRQGDFTLQKSQILTAICAAKDSKSMAQQLAAFLPLLY